MKALADDKIHVNQIFKFLPGRVEDIVGKGENAGKHFLLFPQCCPKPFLSGLLTLYSIDTHFDASTTDRFENIVGKEEIAHYKQFVLFPLCFRLNQVIASPFVHIFDIISLFAAELEEPIFGI